MLGAGVLSKFPNVVELREASRNRKGLALARRDGNIGLYSAEALAEQKRVREVLTQSRELKQMQTGWTDGFTVHRIIRRTFF